MKKNQSVFILVLSISSLLNAQWIEQISGVTSALFTISAANNDVAWMCGNGGVVLRTTNGGADWINVGGGAIGTATVFNIFAWDANFALCTTSPAATFVYRTTDGGSTWTKVFTQTGGFINAIWMFSSTNGFMIGDPVGARWSLWQTANGGATWDSTGLYLAQNGTEVGLINSLFVNGSNIYFGTNNSRVYYSPNMGSSWTSQTMALTESWGIWFNSSTRGIAYGLNQGLVSTTNGGTNWNPLGSLGTGIILSVIGYQNVWYHTRGSRLFGSTDDGATWDTVYVAPAGTFYNLSKARNGEVAWACRSNGGIAKATNIGLPVELTSFTASTSNGSITLHWRTATETNSRIFEIEKKSDNSNYAIIGSVNGQGTSTQAHDYTFVDNNINPINYSYRLKQIDFDGTFEYSNEIEVDAVPTVFSLEQNYPNPFNPSTRIKYQISSSSQVSLKLYDVLGNEVSTLVNEYKPTGSHEVEFSASGGLASGIYIYRLNAGSFIETKKMVLLR